MLRIYIILTFYLFIVLFYLLYINHMVSSYTEGFSGVVVTSQDPVGQCYECGVFYSKLLSIPDATQIMQEITAINGLYDSFFASLDTFLQEEQTICANVATISDFIDCITKYVNDLSCPVGFTQADCVTRSNLLSTIISKASLCPPDNVTCKTLSDFIANLVTVIASIKEDYATCKKNFAASDSACVKQYVTSITTNINANNSAANKSANDNVTLVTQADLKKALFENTTYVTTLGYKG